MNLYDEIKKALDDMDTADLVNIHNEYCSAVNACDSMVYSMDEFNAIMENTAPIDLARMIFYGKEFRPCEDWFYFNGYGNLESFDFYHPEGDTPIYTGDIADYVARNENALYSDDLQEIIDAYIDSIDMEDDDAPDAIRATVDAMGAIFDRDTAPETVTA